ncbi:hypothetical protein [Williamsia sp. M5A3_1d]
MSSTDDAADLPSEREHTVPRDDPTTEEFPTQPTARRRPSAPTVVRALSGITVLAVLASATWYADTDRRVVVTTPAVAQQAAVVGVAPAAPSASAAPKTAPPTSAKPAPSAPAANAPAAAVAITPGGGGATLPGATTIAPGTAATPAVPITPGGGVPGSSTQLGAGGTGLSVAPITEQAACPIGLPKPDKTGGLSSIVELSPMFGPFASEVFALGPAIQPLMQLAGPFLAELEPVIHQNLPFLTPILDQIAGAGTIVLQAILPFYGPYRDQFIAAEGQWAAAIAPALASAYQSPAAACLTAFEGQLIRAAKGNRVTAPSLAHPGRVVTLGPRR